MYVLSVCIYTYTHTGACGHACIHSRLMMYLGLAREKLKCISCLFLQTPAAVHVQCQPNMCTYWRKYYIVSHTTTFLK